MRDVPIPITEATIVKVVSQLRAFRGGTYAEPPWHELVEVFAEKGLGEVRTQAHPPEPLAKQQAHPPEDLAKQWRALPRDVPVRVVGLTDENGQVVRWATDDALAAYLGGMDHGWMVRQGDPREDIVSGYVIVSSDDRIVVG